MTPLAPVAVAATVTAAVSLAALVGVHIDHRLARRRWARIEAEYDRRAL